MGGARIYIVLLRPLQPRAQEAPVVRGQLPAFSKCIFMHFIGVGPVPSTDTSKVPKRGLKGPNQDEPHKGCLQRITVTAAERGPECFRMCKFHTASSKCHCLLLVLGFLIRLNCNWKCCWYTKVAAAAAKVHCGLHCSAEPRPQVWVELLIVRGSLPAQQKRGSMSSSKSSKDSSSKLWRLFPREGELVM